jgi:hypothetical protein
MHEGAFMDKPLGDLPAALFSPAKMVYISFIVLTGLKILPASVCLFSLVSVLFLAVEIFHNDWGRIRLNNSGEKNRPDWDRK